MEGREREKKREEKQEPCTSSKADSSQNRSCFNKASKEAERIKLAHRLLNHEPEQNHYFLKKYTSIQY